ncbi:lasso RiPP family leader peptide-containing protein [Dactylosporangium sp. AC04546]|nr:lasso RiPP family leader peptide-containing protein [Dactylosporangium sp. AC04546]WVK78707.1 lasso RiPP family leader peptide-containing protein [Dactylosporangium sp. AC04546]
MATTYIAPALVEIGNFNELTMGLWSGCPRDWFNGLAWIGC